MFWRFLLYTVITLVGTIAAYPLVPIAVLLADKDGRLPSYFWWLETHDALGWGAGTYEPTIKNYYDKYGKRIAMIMWLWRNKAYALRDVYRATPNYNTMILSESGPENPLKSGFYIWKGTITDGDRKWFEYTPGVSVAGYYLMIRFGWKLKPYFTGHRPEGPTATGMFGGIIPRAGKVDEYW